MLIFVSKLKETSFKKKEDENKGNRARAGNPKKERLGNF